MKKYVGICRLVEIFLYICTVLSAYHVRLAKRQYKTFDCSIPVRTATSKQKKDEQIDIPYWSCALCANFNITEYGLLQTWTGYGEVCAIFIPY